MHTTQWENFEDYQIIPYLSHWGGFADELILYYLPVVKKSYYPFKCMPSEAMIYFEDFDCLNNLLWLWKIDQRKFSVNESEHCNASYVEKVGFCSRVWSALLNGVWLNIRGIKLFPIDWERFVFIIILNL